MFFFFSFFFFFQFKNAEVSKLLVTKVTKACLPQAMLSHSNSQWDRDTKQMLERDSW
jgi:hypothetical protein